MSAHDEQPDADHHGASAAEIHRLQDAIRRLLSCNIEENRNIPGSAGAIRNARALLPAPFGLHQVLPLPPQPATVLSTTSELPQGAYLLSPPPIEAWRNRPYLLAGSTVTQKDGRYTLTGQTPRCSRTAKPCETWQQCYGAGCVNDLRPPTEEKYHHTG